MALDEFHKAGRSEAYQAFIEYLDEMPELLKQMTAEEASLARSYVYNTLGKKPSVEDSPNRRVSQEEMDALLNGPPEVE